MHDFHYNYHYKCHNKTELLLADTDSLMCEIEIENIYADFYKDKELFDFTIYSKESNYYFKSNTLNVRKMKDELCDMLIKKLVGLKAKMHTYITENHAECEKAKDINKNVADDKLKYEDYKTFLFSKVYMRYQTNRFKNKDQNIGTYSIDKVYLPCSNKKKIFFGDAYHRFSHFHKSNG